MSNTNLKINLYQQKDRNGSTYYMGKLKGDFTINCKNGVCFLIFVSDAGSEELQLAPMDKDKND